MYKLLVSFFVVLCSFFSIVAPVYSQQEFTTTFNTIYTVQPTGSADVIQNITLTNNFSQIYATSYALSLEGKKPENIKANQGKTDLPVEQKEEEGKSSITISFPEAVVGKGKTREFTVTYTISNLALQNGQVWELNIPRIGSYENFSEYNLTVNIPKKFGKLAYVSPEPKTNEETGSEYIFSFEKDEIVKAGVVAAFGDFQVFEFNLLYHLQNPYSDKTGKTEIALIPDTAYQRVYYSALDPKPEKIALDEDGNWLATYLLKQSQKLDIQTKGAVQLFSKPQTHYPRSFPQSYHLESAPFWETTDPGVNFKAHELKTPSAIYNYLVDNLKYDFNRVSQDAERLGAKKALENPQTAVCMEFTDLFVALSRASGTPAREVNGFAYTENPEIQPLSLVADILHAWPEYWDENLKVWRPADPTWGNTTGGVDFFNKFDLSHITFAIHGKSSEIPAAAGSYKLAESPERDVSITFGKLPDQRESQAHVQITPKKTWLPLIQNKLNVKIENKGPSAIYQQDVKIRTYGVELKAVENQHLDFLAPFASYEFELSFKMPFSFSKRSSKIQVLVGDSITSYEISQTKIQLLQVVIILGSLLAIVSAGFGIKHVIARRRKPTRQSLYDEPTTETGSHS